ncbi:hypothetical protein CCHR01_01893 [Colletotrichum chrysophilum]|uniref:Uncharacterized protein n=1 Tax=Colletotrichum chrysophilum TaxID=1836956 RepID=A0AAD9ENU5_9PEZI|nr:hypothetical protein CCHR01_01893 [Colletotrichum chrysophilum]
MEKILSPLWIPHEHGVINTPALPHGTSEFVVQHPPLWPQHRRLQGTTIALSVMILTACGVNLFGTSRKRNWRAQAGGLRKTDAARSKSWLWVLERLYVIDVLASITRASFVLWMSCRADVTLKWSEHAYTALTAVDGFFLCLTQIGIVFILSEFDVLFWGKPGQRVEGHGMWYILPRICNFFGWIMAFGLTSIQISVLIVKQYGASGLPWWEQLQSFEAAQDAVTLDLLKILLFLVGFLVLAPYYVVVAPGYGPTSSQP